MKPDLASLGLDDADGAADDGKPSIGDALGEPSGDDGDGSGSDVTAEAKKETGEKLLSAFEAKDPTAMFDAVAAVLSLTDQD